MIDGEKYNIASSFEKLNEAWQKALLSKNDCIDFTNDSYQIKEFASTDRDLNGRSRETFSYKLEKGIIDIKNLCKTFYERVHSKNKSEKLSKNEILQEVFKKFDYNKDIVIGCNRD